MQKEFQKVMMPKSKLHNWPATTQPGQFQEFGATQWLFKFMDDPAITNSCNDAWLTSLVGSPGEVVANKSSARVLLILAVSDFTFVGWDLQVQPRAGDEWLTFLPCKNFALTFEHVFDLNDWVAVPCKPCLQGESGPLMLKQSAEATSLPVAKLRKGLNFTVQQCKDLLKALGMSWQGSQAKSRADFHNLVVDALLDSEAWWRL